MAADPRRRVRASQLAVFIPSVSSGHWPSKAARSGKGRNPTSSLYRSRVQHPFRETRADLQDSRRSVRAVARRRVHAREGHETRLNDRLDVQRCRSRADYEGHVLRTREVIQGIEGEDSGCLPSSGTSHNDPLEGSVQGRVCELQWSAGCGKPDGSMHDLQVAGR